MPKIKSNKLNAGVLNKSFKLTIKQFIVPYEAFSLINFIKGTLVCRKTFINKVLAMVKHPYL